LEEARLAVADRLELDAQSQPPIYKGTHDNIHALAVPATEFDAALAERARAEYGKDIHELGPDQREQVRQAAQADTTRWARHPRYHVPGCPGCAAVPGGAPES
jgi:hypothetical protein